MPTLVTKSAKETRSIAKAFAGALVQELKPGKKAVIIALSGHLGAGKTTFAQGFAAGLGVKEKAKSPTFVLMRQHAIKGKHFTHFYHLDCYRLESHKEASAIGLKEVLGDPRNIVLVEWPEKIKKALPRKKITIRFISINEATRKISFN